MMTTTDTKQDPCRGEQRGRALEAAIAALTEAAGVAGLDQQLGYRPSDKAAELAQRRAALVHKLVQDSDDLLLVTIERLGPAGDRRRVIAGAATMPAVALKTAAGQARRRGSRRLRASVDSAGDCLLGGVQHLGDRPERRTPVEQQDVDELSVHRVGREDLRTDPAHQRRLSTTLGTGLDATSRSALDGTSLAERWWEARVRYTVATARVMTMGAHGCHLRLSMALSARRRVQNGASGQRCSSS